MSLFRRKEEVKEVYPLDRELIDKDKIVRALQQEVQSLKAQISRLLAEKKEKEPETKQDVQVTRMIKDVNEQYQDIKEKKFANSFSFNNLFAYKFGISPRKISKQGKEIELTDKDGETEFGIFGDIVALPKGYLGITNHDGKMIVYGRTLNSIVWKPDSLKNHLKRKTIPLAIDSEGHSTPDIETEEISDVIFDEEEPSVDNNGNPIIFTDENGEQKQMKGMYRETEIFRDTLRNHLIRRDNIIAELRNKTELIENANINMKEIIANKSREIRLLTNKSDNIQSNLSQVLGKTMLMDNRFAEMQNSIATLTEVKAHSENMLSRYRNIVENLLNRIEDFGDQTMYDKVRAQMQDDAEFWKNLLPERTPFIPEKEIEQIVQPGTIIGVKK